MSETTSPQVAAAANRPGVLPMNELAVIGLFERAEGPTALVRRADGEIVRVDVGGRIGAAEVVAIDAEALHLVENGTARALRLPG